MSALALALSIHCAFAGELESAGQKSYSAAPAIVRMIKQNNEQNTQKTADSEPYENGDIAQKTVECDASSLSLITGKVHDHDLLKLSDDEFVLYAEKNGDPLLPAKIVYIAVPPGSRPENIKVNVIDKEILNKKFTILPKQPETTTNEIYKGDFSDLRADLKASHNPFPASPVQFIETATVRGQSMFVFRIWPLQYIPADGSIIFNKRFTWEFAESAQLIPTLKYKKKAPIIDKMISAVVINPEQLQSAASTTISQTGDVVPTNTDCDYLIITSGLLADAFQVLADYRAGLGLQTDVVTTAFIDDNYSGNDLQAKIKNCIIDYATNRGTLWVLLGGDDSVVPDRNCYASVNSANGLVEDATIPTDLYYAGLDDVNWNDDGDNRNCETQANGDTIDMYPDVFVGRAPVRTVNDVNAFVSKTTGYTTNPAPGNFAESALLCGIKLWNTWDGASDAERRTEDMWNNYMAPYWDGFRYRFYDTGTDFYGGADYNVTSAHLQDQISDGYGLIFVASHGNQTIWSMESGSCFGTGNALECTNIDRQGIIYTMACITNAFDQEKYGNDPCLSEAFLRNGNGGAVAYIGSSRYGWGNGSKTQQPGTSIEYAREFFHQLFDSSAMESGIGNGPAPSDYPKILGAVYASHKMYYAVNSASSGPYRWLQFALNLMGDPYLKIHTEPPVVLSPPVIDSFNFDGCISELDTSSILVTATDPSGGNLSYKWEGLYNDSIPGNGAEVTFNPPDVNHHLCPYPVKVTVTSDQSGLSTTESIYIYVHLAGDNDKDGDVDGKDISIMAGSSSADLAALAEEFGRIDGCTCVQ